MKQEARSLSLAMRVGYVTGLANAVHDGGDRPRYRFAAPKGNAELAIVGADPSLQ